MTSWYLFLIRRFYLLVSGQYFLKGANQLCSDEELIHTSEECNFAVIDLRDGGADINFDETKSKDDWPKGCYKGDGTDVYFNSHPSGSANDEANPICRKG